MSSSATGVGMPICFLGAILLILTQKSSQKFGDVLGIMSRGAEKKVAKKPSCPYLRCLQRNKGQPPSPSENGRLGVYHRGQNRYHDST
jgi:hypothetical protein